MGFTQPAPPPVDVNEWRTKPHLEKIKPLAQDWALNGFGSPTAVNLLYLVKLVIFAVGGLALIGATTDGLGGLGSFEEWWAEPIVWQKVVVFTVLWEFLGFGSGSMPLTFRFNPPIGGPLYWLRPGCMRLPPLPDKVPLTAGNTRTWFDVLLAGGVYGGLGYLLLSSGEPITNADALAVFGDVSAGQLEPAAVAITLGFIGLLGLRDKVSFMQTRPDVYAPLLITFLFPLGNMVIASQLVLVFVWIGAASVEVHPSLLLRGPGDGLEHALEPLEADEAPALPAPSGQRPAIFPGAFRRPLRDRAGAELPDPAAARRRRRADDLRGRRGADLPHPHHLDLPARGAAGVEPVHDVRDRLAVRASTRRCPSRPSTARC